MDEDVVAHIMNGYNVLWLSWEVSLDVSSLVLLKEPWNIIEAALFASR